MQISGIVASCMDGASVPVSFGLGLSELGDPEAPAGAGSAGPVRELISHASAPSSNSAPFTRPSSRFGAAGPVEEQFWSSDMLQSPMSEPSRSRAAAKGPLWLLTPQCPTALPLSTLSLSPPRDARRIEPRAPAVHWQARIRTAGRATRESLTVPQADVLRRVLLLESQSDPWVFRLAQRGRNRYLGFRRPQNIFALPI